MLRSGNKFAAGLTLVGDVLKGFIPISLAQYFDQTNGVIALVAIASFMGHLFPIFFAFKGGKGVATLAGIFLALDFRLFAVFAITWLLVAFISRYSSLAALIAALVSALASFAIFNQPDQMQLIGGVALIVAFLFQRHRENIERLKSGQEGKIGGKS